MGFRRQTMIGNSCRWHRAALAASRASATFAEGPSQRVCQLRHLPQQPPVGKVTPLAAAETQWLGRLPITVGTALAKQTVRLLAMQSMEAN